ncbi:hypothetical protein PV318_01485 [Streptomyces sp. ME02-6991-2B]|nr:hypothetical protein [Streptomyces sp. ME02-6991-2B]
MRGGHPSADPQPSAHPNAKRVGAVGRVRSATSSPQQHDSEGPLEDRGDDPDDPDDQRADQRAGERAGERAHEPPATTPAPGPK